MASAERVTLVTLAPKTNVALLLTMYPEVATRLDQIIFMGGAAAGGNVTALAEFNVWQDPRRRSVSSSHPFRSLCTDSTPSAVLRSTGPMPTASVPMIIQQSGWQVSFIDVGQGRTSRTLTTWAC